MFNDTLFVSMFNRTSKLESSKTMKHFTNFYDKTGKLMTDRKEIEEKLRDLSYKRIKKTTLPDGKWVSTVWLGLNHSCTDKDILIFETMVFEKGSFTDIDCNRYATEEEAIKGHDEMVAKYQTMDHPKT